MRTNLVHAIAITSVLYLVVSINQQIIGQQVIGSQSTQLALNAGSQASLSQFTRQASK